MECAAHMDGAMVDRFGLEWQIEIARELLVVYTFKACP